MAKVCAVASSTNQRANFGAGPVGTSTSLSGLPPGLVRVAPRLDPSAASTHIALSRSSGPAPEGVLRSHPVLTTCFPRCWFKIALFLRQKRCKAIAHSSSDSLLALPRSRPRAAFLKIWPQVVPSSMSPITFFMSLSMTGSARSCSRSRPVRSSSMPYGMSNCLSCSIPPLDAPSHRSSMVSPVYRSYTRTVALSDLTACQQVKPNMTAQISRMAVSASAPTIKSAAVKSDTSAITNTRRTSAIRVSMSWSASVMATTLSPLSVLWIESVMRFIAV